VKPHEYLSAAIPRAQRGEWFPTQPACEPATNDYTLGSTIEGSPCRP